VLVRGLVLMMGVVVAYLLAKGIFQVLLVVDQESVRGFLACGVPPVFGGGIGTRGSRR
jgi:hypothetical protein